MDPKLKRNIWSIMFKYLFNVLVNFLLKSTTRFNLILLVSQKYRFIIFVEYYWYMYVCTLMLITYFFGYLNY